MKWRVSTHQPPSRNIEVRGVWDGTVSNITPEISANNAMPGGAESLVKLHMSNAKQHHTPPFS
jgi:hypothetical protein